jgi:hypothetical protein
MKMLCFEKWILLRSKLVSHHWLVTELAWLKYPWRRDSRPVKDQRSKNLGYPVRHNNDVKDSKQQQQNIS